MLFTDPEDQQEKNPTKLGRSCMSSFTYFEHISQIHQVLKHWQSIRSAMELGIENQFLFRTIQL